MSRKLVAVTWVALTLAASCVAYGQTVSNVRVGIDGPSDICVDETERYDAVDRGYDLDEAAQTEVDEGAEIREEYVWSYTPAECMEGGGLQDDWVKIQFSSEQGDKEHTISVTYTVSLVWEGELVHSDHATASMQVHVKKKPSAELCSVTFDSDHGVLRDNNTTWGDEGNLCPEPEWEAGQGWPMSHTMGEALRITVSVKVTPKGAPFDLAGVGGGLSFSGSSSATGIEQDVTMQSTGTLPNHVGVFQPTFTWTIELGDGIPNGQMDLDPPARTRST